MGSEKAHGDGLQRFTTRDLRPIGILMERTTNTYASGRLVGMDPAVSQ